MTTPEQFESWLKAPEGTRLEFKSATGGFHFDKLVDYCVALANEGGGAILLGVTDRRPRQVVGTQAFREPGRGVPRTRKRRPLPPVPRTVHIHRQERRLHPPPRFGSRNQQGAPNEASCR